MQTKESFYLYCPTCKRMSGHEKLCGSLHKCEDCGLESGIHMRNCEHPEGFKDAD